MSSDWLRRLIRRRFSRAPRISLARRPVAPNSASGRRPCMRGSSPWRVPWEPYARWRTRMIERDGRSRGLLGPIPHRLAAQATLEPADGGARGFDLLWLRVALVVRVIVIVGAGCLEDLVEDQTQDP